ncbi:MAG TPA: DUF3455 domain-containing protein [Terriglobales bacterium]|nr:DUF3455 domain-containing protein [Terriglobales bacterium]
MLTRSLLALTAMALFATSAVAQDIPAKLALPQGARLVGKYAAKGVQIYTCRVKSDGSKWSFKAPEAELTEADGKLFARHYAGPTWEAFDGSKAFGTIMATEPAPKADTIPWLLLSTQSQGPGVLAKVRFVQRIDTSGGIKPTGACPSDGAEQRVDYTADYVFYR